MIIEESVEINAPLPVLWNVFSKMEDWQSWNTVCQNCCLITGDSMAQDTCFSFNIRPYYLPIKVTPAITKCEPGKEVIWEGRRFNVQAAHRFFSKKKRNRFG